MRRKIRPRDRDGWRIPREGTKSRIIYECLKSKIPVWEIHKYLGGNVCTINGIIQSIKNPGRWYKKMENRQYKGRQYELPLLDEQ